MKPWYPDQFYQPKVVMKQSGEQVERLKAHIARCQAREHALRLKYKAEVPSLKLLVKTLKADARRINLIESKRATVYASVDIETGKLEHWVFVDETKRSRSGVIGDSLRAAVDAAKDQL